MLSLLIGGVLLVPFAFIHGLLGFVMGETVKTGKTKLYTLWQQGLHLLITGMIMYVAAVFFFNFNAIDELFNTMDEYAGQIASFMGKMGGLPDDYDKMMDSKFVLPNCNSIPFYHHYFCIGVHLYYLNLEVASRLGNISSKVPTFP